MNDRYARKGEQNPAYGNLWSFIFLLIAALFLTPVFNPELCFAGYISLNGEPKLKLTVEGDNLLLEGTLAIKNNGDEMAPDVEPELAVADLSWKGDRRIIQPKETNSWEVHLSKPLLADAPREGAYPLVARIAYADLNGYPFSNVSVAPLSIGIPPLGTNRLPELGVSMKVFSHDNQRFTANVEVFNRTQNRHHVKLSFFSPRDFEATPARSEMDIEAGSFSVQRFKLDNQTGLPGSNYMVYAVAQWEQDGRAEFSSNGAVTKVDLPKYGYQWLIAGCVGSVLALLALLLLSMKSYFANRPRALASAALLQL